MSTVENFLKVPAEFLSRFSSPGAVYEAVSSSVHGVTNRYINVAATATAAKKEEGITRELFQFSGFSFHVPVNYLEDFREKVSAKIPAFYDSYLVKMKEVLGRYNFTKNAAAKIDPTSPKVWIVTSDIVMMIALAVLQQFYFITMGLYLMNVETIKLLADGKMKDGAANFALGAVVFSGYFVFATLATIGMVIRYVTGNDGSKTAKGNTNPTPPIVNDTNKA